MSIAEKAGRPLAELGADPAGVEKLYAELRTLFDQELAHANGDAEQVKKLRDRWLGRKQGLLTATNEHWLKPASRELKPVVGKLQNSLKTAVEQAIEEAAGKVGHKAAGPQLDVTLPGPRREIGARHPIRIVQEEIESIFRSIGYSVFEGPEIETDYYNFEALNFPADHPARDAMDTIFITGNMVLRTHTSPCQIRIMESQRPPLRYIVPGKVYRNDAPDASHSPMFHQVEGFAVDEKISFCDLKGTLDHFLKRFFGPEIRTRFRPSFFPFTEPSAEVDISSHMCGGKGCRVCKQSGYIELLGCGMIDPALYKYVGYDPERCSGFAFGMGVDRLAMLKYGINDIQLFFQGDVRFLRQFRQ
jgi:phenylalanyl-tRNA synthetase alpha chain